MSEAAFGTSLRPGASIWCCASPARASTIAMLMQFSARFGELDRVPIAAANFDRADSDLPRPRNG